MKIIYRHPVNLRVFWSIDVYYRENITVLIRDLLCLNKSSFIQMNTDQRIGTMYNLLDLMAFQTNTDTIT